MVAGDGDATRVHVHTDDPDAVIALFGDVRHLDVSDMRPPTTAFALAARLRGPLRLDRHASGRGAPPCHGGSVAVLAAPQAALVAALAFDPRRTPEENSAALLDAIARVRTASVAEGGELAPAMAAVADGAELVTVVTGEAPRSARTRSARSSRRVSSSR